MVAGRPPFTGSRDELVEQHVSTPAPRLRSVAPQAPEWLDALVADLLAKTPAERPGVFKLVQRLEDGVGHPLPAPKLLPLDADGLPGPPVRAGGGPPRSRCGSLGVGALLLIGGTGAGLVLVGAAAVVALVLTLPK